jgi:hypothetical protein
MAHVGVNTDHELYFMICILLSALVGWCIEYKTTVINPLMTNDLYRRRAVSPLKIKIPSKKSLQAALHGEI